MAFKTFTNGSVLTDSDLNTYLMKQVVVACTSGTRPASPPEGMCIYEADTDRIMTYNTSWREISRANYADGAASMTSGFTATKNYVYRRGSFGFLQLTFTRGSAMAALTTHIVGNLGASANWPSASYDFNANSNGGHILTCWVDTNGDIIARPFTQIAAGTNVILNTVYPLV